MQLGYILVEGQTELFFVPGVLDPFLKRYNLSLQAISIDTSAKQNPQRYRGGSAKYTRWRRDILRLLADPRAVLVTTMLDYYRLPQDFPGRNEQSGTCFDRVIYLERRFSEDIDNYKFIPYIALHEFEALLFANPEKIADSFPKSSASNRLKKIRA